jgi:uncharacterized protein (DUF427 family)
MNNLVSAWEEEPDYKINIIQIKGRVGIVIGDVKLVDSDRVLLLSEQDHVPIYYFPRADINMELLHKTKKVTFCPYKGEAEHWGLYSKNTQIEVAAWSYPAPFEQVSEIQDYIAFYPDVMKNIVIN